MVTNDASGTVGPSIRFNAINKDWVIMATGDNHSDGDQKLIFRDYSQAQTRMVIDRDGHVGVGVRYPEAQLDVAGGQWDLNNTEGDFRIGDDNYRLKIGIATGGGGAGSVGLRAVGGAEKLILGSGIWETLTVSGNDVDIGSNSQVCDLRLYDYSIPSGPAIELFQRKIVIREDDGVGSAVFLTARGTRMRSTPKSSASAWSDGARLPE